MRATPRASSTASFPPRFCVMRATPRASSTALFPPRICVVIESNAEGFVYNFIPSERLSGDREQRPGLLLQLHPLQEFVWRPRATPRASSIASIPPRICVVRATPRASSTASSQLGICVMRATPRASSTALFPPRICVVIESNAEGFFYNFILSKDLCDDREQHRRLLLQLHPLQGLV